MLRRIGIRDFVIVEQATLEFESGFTVLTGETGAGKSILIDALSLALGERGDAGSVRAGARQAEISADFELTEQTKELTDWLAESGLEGDPGICLLRRVVESGGRSRAFINGHATTVAQLHELGEMLIDIHGQHAHQSLLRAASQRELLDAYAGASEIANAVGMAYRRWSELTLRYEGACRDAARLGHEHEQLGWQVNDLARLEFDSAAWAQLNAEHARLAHAASLIEASAAAIEALSEGEHAASSLVNGVVTRLTRACELDSSLKPVLEVLQTAQIQVQEAVYALERYQSKLEIDPQRLADVELKMQAVHEACRKYRLKPESLPAALAAAQARLAELDLDLDLSRLERAVAEAKSAYMGAAAKLTAARRKAGAALGRQVSAAIQDLALTGGKFSVILDELREPAAHGLERIEFLVASHAALEPGPLNKVASGGELSRLSLAVQTVLSRVARVPTLIFDEVDAGIGGRVAQIVGQMLHRLGAHHQVMCVTHLAQVAACADHHWRVSKQERAGQVLSRVEVLDPEQRVEEIARMLGGVKITRATLDHAAELLRETRGSAAAS